MIGNVQATALCSPGFGAPLYSGYPPSLLLPRYSPPHNREEVLERSKFMPLILTYMKSLLHEQDPQARQEGDFYVASGIKIALQDVCYHQSQRTFHAGSWINANFQIGGRNPVSLFAYVRGTSYAEAFNFLRDKFTSLEKGNRPKKWARSPRWNQERQPMRDVDPSMWNTPQLDWGGECWLAYADYINAHGHKIGRAFYPEHEPRAEPFYQMLYSSEGRLQVLDALPNGQLPLFNERLVATFSVAPILVVDSEKDARMFVDANIRVTVPGGVERLPEANLAYLRGRKVRVVLTLKQMENAAILRQCLQKADVGEALFSIGVDGPVHAFSQLEKVACDFGVDMKGDETKRDAYQVVITKSGQPPHGFQNSRKVLLDPVICEGYLVWIYAEPKVGKTQFGTILANVLSASNAQIGPWTSSDRHGVLYIDGEMLPDKYHELARKIRLGGYPDGEYEVLSAFAQKNERIDLLCTDWQDAIEGHLTGKNVLILDNFQSLTDNGIKAMDEFKPWFRRLMLRGIAVIVLDHTNQDGQIQGSSSKLRNVDLSIRLSFPDDEAKANGIVQVECKDCRYLPPMEPLLFQKRSTEDEFWWDCVSEPDKDEGEDGGDTVNRLPHLVEKRAFVIALTVVLRRCLSLSFPEIYKRYGIPQSSAVWYLKAVPKLIGAEKLFFEQECVRLKQKLLQVEPG